MTWHFKNGNIFILHRVIQQDDMIYLVGEWEGSNDDDKGHHLIPLSDTPAMAKLLSDIVTHSIPYDWIKNTDKPHLDIIQKVYDTGHVEIFSIGNGNLRIPLQPCYALYR